eukprot:1628227-Rhodomonas_salina.2
MPEGNVDPESSSLAEAAKSEVQLTGKALEWQDMARACAQALVVRSGEALRRGAKGTECIRKMLQVRSLCATARCPWNVCWFLRVDCISGGWAFERQSRKTCVVPLERWIMTLAVRDAGGVHGVAAAG